MLQELKRQLTEWQTPGRAEVLLLYNSEEVESEVIQQALDQAGWVDTEEGAYRLRVLPTPGLSYYDQKNYGVGQTARPLIIFLDSDVVPETGWLENLVRPFEDPEVKVVGGTTFLSMDTRFERAFALFWFFPPREEGGAVRAEGSFMANNVAFRREVVSSFPFPRSPLFRGQCQLLAQRLRDEGITIFRNPECRVSHPPPNGLSHTVCRAICQGHDNVVFFAGGSFFTRPPLGSFRRFFNYLFFALQRARSRRKDVAGGPLDLAAAVAISLFYYTFVLLGELLSHISPRFVRDRFSI